MELSAIIAPVNDCVPIRPAGSRPEVSSSALWPGMSPAARPSPFVTIPCSFTVTLVKEVSLAIAFCSGIKMFPDASTSRPEASPTLTAPAVVAVAIGKSAAVRILEAVIRPCSLNVTAVAVPATTVLSMVRSPAASTVRPESVGTETAPRSSAVAAGKSAATSAVVSVI